MPNCLFAVAVSVSLLYPSYNSYTLVSLFTFALLLLFWFNLAFSTPWRSPQGLPQIPPDCVNWGFCWISHPFPTILFIANLTQLLYSRVDLLELPPAVCSSGGTCSFFWNTLIISTKKTAGVTFDHLSPQSCFPVDFLNSSIRIIFYCYTVKPQTSGTFRSLIKIID